MASFLRDPPASSPVRPSSSGKTHQSPATMSPYTTITPPSTLLLFDDRDVEDCKDHCSVSSSSTSKTTSMSPTSSSSPEWDISSAVVKIRSRLKGRHSPTQSSTSESVYNNINCDNDKSPLLHSDSSDSEECSGPPSSSTHAVLKGEAAGLGPHQLQQWLRLLVQAVLLSCLLYYVPGLGLEIAYFPARGRMMPGGLNSLTSTPTYSYEAASSSSQTDDLQSSLATATAAAATTTSSNAAVHIPRIVHVTYKSREELPPEWQFSIKEWETIHPNWEVRFWSDNDIAEFVHKEFPEMEALFQSYKYTIQRVDSVRYMILYHYGGVYSDMDIYPATALDKLLQQWEDAGKNVLLAETLNSGVTNAFMAAAPQSDFMACVIENLPRYQHRFYHVIGWQHWEVLSSAGSTYLWGMVGHCQDEGVEVLAARSFRECSVCDAWETGQPADSCDTEWLHHSSTNSSWHQHESWFHALCFTVSYSIYCRPFRACFIIVSLVLALLHRRRNTRRILKS